MFESEHIVALIILVVLLLFCMKDELIISMTTETWFKIGIIVVGLYFIYNNISDGVILIVGIGILLLFMKPNIVLHYYKTALTDNASTTI